tara:strand:+ start:232 stop:2412 length:2181 start_codon:yes stop_codon:yes gene_type:complete
MKNRKRNSLGQFTKKSSKSEISFVNLSTYTSPEIVEVPNQDWIAYGEDNNYFQFLIDRYNGSPTNNACINGISQQIYGKGLGATDSNRKPEQYAQMITLFKKDVVRKLSYDLKLMGQCAMQVIYSKDRTKIAQIEHMPIETLRAEKADDDGDIPAYYYFKDWTKIKPSDKPLRIPAYGMSKENIEIYYIKPYKSGFYYYAPVDYQGGIQYAELEEEISNYHLNNIMNGLSPSMLINFNNGTPNPQERELIEARIAQKFSGSSNAGKFILSFNDNKDAQAEITPVQLSDAHNQYQFLSDESQSKVLVAHRVVSPMLLGIKDNTGLGNNAEEIKTASLLMDNTVIRPFQELLIDCFDDVLAYNNIALNLYFITLQPLEFTDVDRSVQSDEEVEEETGVKMSKIELKIIDGKKAYETIDEAEKIAKEKGCNGHHEHEVNGEIFYMPCENHEELKKSPCWDGYVKRGTKIKDGKEVNNCIKVDKLCCASETPKLSEEEIDLVLGSLGKSGVQMNDEYEFVDELDEDSEYSDSDWANYLVEEKKSTLNKIRDILGLKKSTENNVGSVNDGSAFSQLDSKNGLYKIRYKYARGKFSRNDKGEFPKSRSFCTEMMNLSGNGLVWRIEDIDNASYGKLVIKNGKGTREPSKTNTEFRHRPDLPYDIFTLKGGVYCYHKWVRVLYRLKSSTKSSENLDNYKKTRTIPKSYIKNPRGSKKAAQATISQDGEGAFPK